MDNILKALIKAKQSFKPVQKTATNPFFHSKYAPLASLIEATQEALAENGLVITQTNCFLDGRQCLQTILYHESGEKLESITELITMEDSRGTNKLQQQGASRTYLRRYEYAGILGLAEEDDTDGNSKEQTKTSDKSEKPKRTKDQQSDPEIAFWKLVNQIGDKDEAHKIIKKAVDKESAKDVTYAEWAEINRGLVSIINCVRSTADQMGKPVTFDMLVKYVTSHEPAWEWSYAVKKFNEAKADQNKLADLAADVIDKQAQGKIIPDA